MYSSGIGRPVAVGVTGGTVAATLPQTGGELLAAAFVGVVLVSVGFLLLRVQLRARAARS